MIFTCIGSFYTFDTTVNHLEQWIKNGIFIDPRSGKPMEMDALSLYNISQLISADNNWNIFFEPLFRRLEEKKAFCCHDSWNMNETHLRFSSAGIKLMVSLINCNGKDKQAFQLLDNAIDYHFSFKERLNEGVWFYHDSQEKKDVYHDYHISNRIWGSSDKNMLILNTHIESVNLLFHIKKNESIYQNLRQQRQRQIDLLIVNGINALCYILNNRKKTFLYSIDSLLRNSYLSYFSKNKQANLFWQKYFYRFRIVLKSKYPVFFHTDGYTEREICLAGISFYYHIVNINDLSKLLCNMQIHRRNELSMMRELENIIKKGINYAVTNTVFIKYIENCHPKIKVELCEAILLAIHTLKNVSKSWIEYYCSVRKKIEPSPGLKGSDVTFNYAINYFPDLCRDILNKPVDILCVDRNNIYLVNYSENQIELLINDSIKTLYPNSCLTISR